MVQDSSGNATQESHLEIFCSWSQCEEDKRFFKELEKKIASLQSQHQGLQFRHQGLIHGGEVYNKTVKGWVSNAHLILLLLSADFLASEQCLLELSQAINRQEACVIPVIIRSCAWEDEVSLNDRQCLPKNKVAIESWPNRDDASKEVLESISTVVKRLIRQLPIKVYPFPFNFNQYFTNHDALLEQLHYQFLEQPRLPQAIRGQAGTGKTQLALEYAYRYQKQTQRETTDTGKTLHAPRYKDYEDVFWVQAKTKEELIASYIEFARHLQLSQKDVREQKTLVNAVKDWLSKSRDWLLVLDDVDNLDIIQEFLPSQFTGHLLLTTQLQASDQLANFLDTGHLSLSTQIQATRQSARLLEIGVLDKETGVRLLLKRSHLVKPHASLPGTKSRARAITDEIVEELKGLPLALNQAGAYIQKEHLDPADYLGRYQKRRKDQVHLPVGLSKNVPEPVVITTLLSIEKIAQFNSSAADLLELCTLVAPNAISEELLKRALNNISHFSSSTADKRRKRGWWLSWLRMLWRQRPDSPHPTVSKQKIEDALDILENYALILRYRPAKTLTVHPLVQMAIYDNLSTARKQQLANAIIFSFEAAYPECLDFANWPFTRQLPHMFTFAEKIARIELKTFEAVYWLSQAGYYLHEQGRDIEAERFYQDSLKTAELLSSTDHPDIADILNNLAGLYQVQGKKDEAETYYNRSLQIRAKNLGPQSLRTAIALHNLGFLYASYSHAAKAKDHYQSAFEIRRKQLGSEHPHTTAIEEALKKLQERWIE